MDKEDRDLEILKLEIEAWKTTIDVQMHFNDLQMKVRNFGIFIISALLGGAGISLKGDASFAFNEHQVSIAVFFLIAAILVWFLIYLVDMKWYYPLLVGSVKHGLEVEKRLSEHVPTATLTTKIKDESAVPIFCFDNVRSETKGKVFYFGFGVILVILTVCLFNVKPTSGPSASESKVELKRNENMQVDVEPAKLRIDKIESVIIN